MSPSRHCRTMIIRSLLPLAALACTPAAAELQAPDPTVTQQTSGTTALLQAVSVVDTQTVWVSGHAGTWARTTDGGDTWTTGRVAGADTLQFRDVHASSADTAWLMAAGPGEMSRIYRTTDGGASWTLQHTNDEPQAFYDCFAFWSDSHGVLFSDQVDGQTVMLETTDGTNWTRIPASRVPAPAGTEGAFAASGTCLTTFGDQLGWVATGVGTTARIFRTEDRGGHWTAVPTPVAVGPTTGLTTVAFRDAEHGIALGGDVANSGPQTDDAIVTTDGGRTWSPTARPSFHGAVFGAVYATGVQPAALVAVGPGGMAMSHDDGQLWARLDTLAYWSVGFGDGEVGWAVGPRGRIARVDLGVRKE